MRGLASALIAAALLVAPASASAALDGEERDDVFRITGDAADDRVSAIANGTSIAFDFGADGTVDESVAMADITSVVVDLGPGSDSFSAVGNLASEGWSLLGGPGADSLLGTNGVDRISGGSGADFVDGQQSNDVVELGTGADAVRWDPGDGSEPIDGGGDADLDTLEFNGSAANEVFSITDSGAGVRLTRNIANIVLDLTRVDLIDLEALGGTDSITSSGIAERAHLSIDAGAQEDTVTTGGGADRIVGGSEADTIDAGAGDDRVFGGAGADNLFGREGDDGLAGGEGADSVNGGPNFDGCTEVGDLISDCESATLPAEIAPRPFPHPLEPEEPPAAPGPADPGPADPGPADPGPSGPGGEQPAPVAGFAIERVAADRRGLRVTVAGTGAEAVEVEVAASEAVKRSGRRGKRRIEYAPVTRVLAAGEAATVRLRAPRRHRATLATASKRRARATVTNVTNGLSETEEIRKGR